MTNEIVKLIENNIENVDITLVDVKTKMDNAVEDCEYENGKDYHPGALASHLLHSLLDNRSYMGSIWDNEEIDADEACCVFSDEPKEVTKIIANKLTDETAKFYFIGRMQAAIDALEAYRNKEIADKWNAIETYVWDVASEVNCAVGETELKKEYKEWAAENYASTYCVSAEFLMKKVNDKFGTYWPSVFANRLAKLVVQAKDID